MGVADQGNRFPGKQVDSGQQGYRPKTPVFIITGCFPIPFSWAQAIRCIGNCLDSRFFILRCSDCKLIVIRRDKLPVFIKLKFHLLVNQQKATHFGFKQRISFFTVIADFKGFDASSF